MCVETVRLDHNNQTVHQNTIDGGCLTPTTIKVGVVVFGLLLIGAGLTMYFMHVNAIAAYITGGIGGAAILGMVVWSIVDCLRGKNENSERLDNNSGVQEAISARLDLSKFASNPQVTENDVNELHKNNEDTKTHIQVIYTGIKYSERYSAEAQNLIIKLGWEEKTIVEISLRKQNLDFVVNEINQIIDKCSCQSIIVCYHARGQIFGDKGTINIRLVTFVKNTKTDLQ